MESNPVIQLFLALGILIAAAQLSGALARALGQPRVFGQLLAGVLVGPSLLDVLSWPVFDHPDQLSHTIHELAELGVLFLMFAVGLEVQLQELLAVGKVALWGGVFGVLLPVALAVPVVLGFDHPTEEALFVGIVMAATSVSISAQTLLELRVLRTKEGIGLLATAVVDDILAILLLSIGIAVFSPEEAVGVGDLVWIFARMVLYLGGALAVAWFILPHFFNWIQHHRQFSQGTVAFALIAALLLGWSAEALGGIAAITGAFIAGLGVGQTMDRVKHEIEAAVQYISYSFLVPIFFINVGLNTDLTQIGLDILPLAGLLLLAAVVSKVVGAGFGARLGGFNRIESLRLGVCMISRGEVGLIIASLGLANGLLSDELFRPVFLVILLTTVLTPPLVRLVFRQRSVED